MQAYRGMDIGTAKPTPDIRQRIPHHLIDIADPSETLTVQRYQELGRTAIDEALVGHGRVVICGGSGLHFRALVDPMSFAPTDAGTRAQLEALDHDEARSRLLRDDPAAADHVDLGNPRRVVRALEVIELTGATPSARAASPEGMALARYEPQIPFTGIGIDPGPEIARRVEQRFDAMLASGLLDEVGGLAGRLGPTASQAVGYKELVPVAEGREDLETARDAALRATNALVKRQRTFFRRDPRIVWYPWQDEDTRRIETAVAAIGDRVAWNS